ncbi:MAG: VOC family protein [Anaerolineae bacterium]
MQLKKITIAPINVKAMVHFYNHVFDAQLEPFEALGTTLYSGQLAGIELLFCPNEILGINAEKNRQQLAFSVGNLEAIIELVLANHGKLMGEVQVSPEGKACGVTDPDGNSIELLQK